ncbi:MAG: fumarylacetoacetate hydrolase family protein [Spirochaetaceae bacterium]|jgi:2-keto-4-pentenoate hydratase/2-oxohepta-3-ene-1,7-dioic acid hydratase in catechol pathway|nr:fumarylacetoacetate hydrolase family protein [Spirochaetaceae bacterium]
MENIKVNGKFYKPGKIVCVGRNYVEHIQELGNEIPENMVIFLKPSTAISKKLLSEHRGEEIHYEGEISFLYQKGQFTAVSFGLDLTKRKLQTRLKEKGLPWERAKAFDGAALFSDFVSFNNDYSKLSLELYINEKLIQSAGTELMMYQPEQILEEITQFMTLQDGDIVMTGTPKGVGLIKKGLTFSGVIREGDHDLIKAQWISR